MPFSLSWSLFLLKRKYIPTNTPATASTSIHHRSCRDACRIRLLIHARRKSTLMVSQKLIQNLVIYPQNIIVRHKADVIQNIALNINGGSSKRNCKMLSPMKMAEQMGCLNTNCPAKSGLNSFSFESLRFKVRRKILSAIITRMLNTIFPLLFSA